MKNQKGFMLLTLVVAMSVVPLVVTVMVSHYQGIIASDNFLKSGMSRQQMEIIRNLTITNVKDVDGDGEFEPLKEEVGNAVPAAFSVPGADQYGTPLRYYTWDLGLPNWSNTAYSQNGTAPPLPGLLARVVSAGPDKTFQTLSTSMGVQGDDYIVDVFKGDVLAYNGGGWTDDGVTVRLNNPTDNVGIGTSTPSQKLDVLGSVVVRGMNFGQIFLWSGTDANWRLGASINPGFARALTPGLNAFVTFPGNIAGTGFSIGDTGSGISVMELAGSANNYNAYFRGRVSTSGGLVPPALTTAQRDALTSPVAGLLIYNSDTGNHDYYTGASWLPVGGGAPAGTVAAFAGTVAPPGWLICNGVAVSRTTYGALFSTIGIIYGAGNGATTFNLPDLRGEFIRGWDAGRGADSGRMFGTSQSDELKSHTHSYTTAAQYGYVSGGGSPPTFMTPGSVSTGATGGTETRPRNVAMNYIIKY